MFVALRDCGQTFDSFSTRIVRYHDYLIVLDWLIAVKGLWVMEKLLLTRWYTASARLDSRSLLLLS